MKKSTKKFTSTLLAAASVAGVIVPATQVLAEEKMTVEKAQALVDYAKKEKNFAEYNIAYAAILQLDKSVQDALLAELAPLYKDVVTADVQKALDILTTVAKDLDLGSYYDAKALIEKEVSSARNVQYLLGELTSWGHAGVFTAEVVAATDAIGKLWTEPTLENEKAAKEAVAKVKNTKSVAWLNVELENAAKPIVRELKVETVSATNLKEVVLTFNKEVDATEAAKAANYEVKNNTVAAATVSSDKKTVTLRVGTKLEQQAEVEVTVKKALGLALDTVVKTTVMDVTIPVAESLKLTGPNTFEVTFSEPVQNGDTPEVLINNGVYGISSKVLSANGRVLTVTLSASTLPEGDYAVKVSGYKDFANFAAMAKTFELAYAKDAGAPTVALKSASQTEVKVTFNKAVTQKGGAALTKDYFYQTYSAWKPYNVTTTDNKTFTLTFTDADANTIDPILPEGNVVITVLKSVGDVAVVDAWGNELAADAKLVATIEADKTAPTVKSVEATAENEIKVVFSEDVVKPVNTNFVIKNSDGKVVSQTITNIEYDAEKFEAVLTLSGKLSGGNYTVEVKDIVDKALSANKITAVTTAINVTDKTAIELDEIASVVVDNATAKEQYVYVTFPERVTMDGDNGALNKSNYLVAGQKLASSDKIEAFGSDGKRVKITIAYRGTPLAPVVTAGTTKLTVGRIADAIGNLPTLISDAHTIAADAAPATFTAEAIALNKVKLTFEAELKTVIAEGITVDNGDGTFSSVAAIDSVVVNEGKTTVIVTVKADEKLADKSVANLAKLQVKVVADKLETITGKKLGDITVTTVDDAIAPEFTGNVTLARTSATKATIVFSFDEALKADLSTDLMATDLVVKDANGKTYVAAVDYTVAYTGAEVTVTLTLTEAAMNKLNGTKFTIGTKDTVTYIKDGADNVVKPFSGKTTSIALPVAP